MAEYLPLAPNGHELTHLKLEVYHNKSQKLLEFRVIPITLEGKMERFALYGDMATRKVKIQDMPRRNERVITTQQQNLPKLLQEKSSAAWQFVEVVLSETKLKLA
jgi:hypothetical protein